MQQAEFNNRFSVCLLNTDTGRVEETSFIAKNFKNNESLFDLPPILSMSFAEDGIADEIMGNDFLLFDTGEDDD